MGKKKKGMYSDLEKHKIITYAGFCILLLICLAWISLQTSMDMDIVKMGTLKPVCLESNTVSEITAFKDEDRAKDLCPEYTERDEICYQESDNVYDKCKDNGGRSGECNKQAGSHYDNCINRINDKCNFDVIFVKKTDVINCTKKGYELENTYMEEVNYQIDTNTQVEPCYKDCDKFYDES